MQYICQYNNFIKKAPWYYQISRYFFKEQLFGNQSPSTSAPKDPIKYLYEKKDHLTIFAKNKSHFICWLVGLDAMIGKISGLIDKAISAVHQQLQQEEKSIRSLELKQLNKLQAVTNFSNSEEFKGSMDKYLTQKQNFMDTIPKPSYQLMPHLFERFGRDNEIVSAPCVSGGKPMTYANLTAEKKATVYAQERARTMMISKRERYPFYNAGDYDPGKRESDIIDGEAVVIRRMDEQLEILRTQGPSVEIGNLEPYVSYMPTR